MITCKLKKSTQKIPATNDREKPKTGADMIRYKLKIRKSKIDTTPEIPEYRKYKAPTTLLHEFILYRPVYHLGHSNSTLYTKARIVFACLYESAKRRGGKLLYPRLLTSYNKLAIHFGMSERKIRELINRLQNIKVNDVPLMVCRPYTLNGQRMPDFKAKERPIEIVFTGHEHLQHDKRFFYFKINLHSFKDKLTDASRLFLFMLINSTELNKIKYGTMETRITFKTCSEWFEWDSRTTYRVFMELSLKGYSVTEPTIKLTEKAYKELPV